MHACCGVTDDLSTECLQLSPHIQVVVLLREVQRSSARMALSLREMTTSMSTVSGDGVTMSGSASEGSGWRALADHLTVLFKERLSTNVGATLKADLTSLL